MNELTAIAVVPQDISPKRRLVARAAEELFLALGYGAVSMDQVARRAGVSKATLYAYFPSKDALFANLMHERGMDGPLCDDLFPDEVTDLRAALETISERLLRFMLQERTLAIYRMALSEAVRFPELGQAFYQNGPQHMSERFIRWLEMLRGAGLVEAEDLTVATQQFMALMRSGVFLRRSLAVPPEASEQEIKATAKAAARAWLKAYERK